MPARQDDDGVEEFAAQKGVFERIDGRRACVRVYDLNPLLKGSGAAEGTRTPDPIITNDVLYQLSYSGVPAGLIAGFPAGG
jgi:hypothetical protein